MKHLKKLGLSLTLIFVLPSAGFAQTCVKGIMETPPCALASPSDDEGADPGQTPTPPAAPWQTETPPASDSVGFVGLVEAALWSLSLF